MRYAPKKTAIRVATETFAKTCNILKKRRNLSLCELTEEPFFTVEKSRIVRIGKMRAMGFAEPSKDIAQNPLSLVWAHFAIFFISLHAPQFPLQGLDVLLPVQYIAL